MKLLISGICGFVGSEIATRLSDAFESLQIIGIDNLVRRGSERNLARLERLGVRVFHGDLRCASDLEPLPTVDWVIDAAALPSVMAGVDGQTSSRQVVEHNLVGTLNLIEYCRRSGSGCILLSTSRVYSIPALAALPMQVQDDAFALVADLSEATPSAGSPKTLPAGVALPPGISPAGISETFSTTPPVSVYGATKLASETMTLEFGAAYDFPVWINRCGVLAGAGQFARPDQGIFAFWIHSHGNRNPLQYIGFGGSGHQVRDCLHPEDLSQLIAKQLLRPGRPQATRVFNVGGGIRSAISLRQLTRWCDQRFGKHPVASSDGERPFDLPWVVMDCSLATQTWDWTPQRSLTSILEEIADFSCEHSDWLETLN